MSSNKSPKQRNFIHKKHTPKNKKARNQKNDVLVLPPDLLQKLGINLENIQSPQEFSLVKKAGACSNLKQILATEASDLHLEAKYIVNDKESSIIETANLMKASVLLSPTFNSIKAHNEINSVTSIEELVTETIGTIQSDEQNKHCDSKDELKADSIKCVNIGMIYNDETQLDNVELTYKGMDNTMPSEILEKGLDNNHILLLTSFTESKNDIKQTLEKEVFESSKILNEKDAFHNNAMVQITKDTITTVEEIIKNNASTSSNNEHQYHIEKVHTDKNIVQTNVTELNQNFEENTHNSSTNCCPEEFCDKLYEIHNSSKASYEDNQLNKIEEVCDNTLNNCSFQVENVQSCSSLDKQFTFKEPIIEAFCGDKAVQENSEIQTVVNGNLSLSAITEYKDDIQHIPCSAMREANISNDSSNEHTQQLEHKKYNLNNTPTKNDTSMQRCQCTKKNTICKCHDAIHDTDTTSSESKVPLDKVEEIAYYLSQVCYTGLKRRNSKTKNVNTTGYSKLSIQGVEKPGGVVENIHLNRNIKTYSRHKNPKFSNVFSSFISSPKYNINSNIDYKISDRNLSASSNELKYCLCGDFGTFFNYDVDNNYEHIHFCKRNEAQCSVETLFSIYEDNNIEDKYKKDDITIHAHEHINKDDKLEIPDDSSMGICWNSAAYICEEGNYELIPQQNLENINDAVCLLNKKEQCDKADMCGLLGKRKRADKTSESESNCQKPLAKKATIAVVCGVCNSKVSKNEWNTHISEEHCFIAWREGQEIDLKSKDLFLTLSERLHSTDKLICTFCEAELYKVQKFLKHVSKCKRRKGKLSNASEHSKISGGVLTVPELEKSRVIEVHSPHNKNEKQIKQKSLRGKKIKRNIEEQVKFAEKPLEKRITIAGETMLPVTIDEIKVSQEKKQKPVPENPVLQENSGNETLVTEKTVLQAESGLKRLTRVSCNENEQKFKAVVPSGLQVLAREKLVLEVPVLPERIGDKHTAEDPVLLVETDEIQDSEESVIPVARNKKAASKIQVLQVETIKKQAPEVSVSQVGTLNKNVTCGVCNEVVCERLWIEHITQKHNYIAWKDNEPPLDCEDEDEIRSYLNYIIKDIGELVCKVCGLKRKFAKSYLKHIKNCQNRDESDEQDLDQTLTPVKTAVKTEKSDAGNTSKVKAESNSKEDEEVNAESIKKECAENIKNAEMENVVVKCGVCKLELTNAHWIEHIRKEHDYLAWQEGGTVIDLNNSQQVHDHLFNLSKQNDGLTCRKCGLNRKYVKSYLKHIESCDETTNNSLNESTLDTSTVDALILDLSSEEDAKCGVCKTDVEGKNWFNHVHLCHAYLAWKEGNTSLDLENNEQINCYLYLISKKYDGLICNKCGLTRKYVKAYLSHLESCDSTLLSSSMIVDANARKDSYECVVCAEKVDRNDWNTHNMKLHYNLAWVLGDIPIDTKNASVVEKKLKVYKQECGEMKCNECGATRVSPMGFYAHIIQCGKTEEEIDKYKLLCEICNSKYLFIYKRQHAIMHREQEFKEIKLKERMMEKETIDSPKTEQISERRRAAERARQFIEKSETFTYNCSTCGYGADDSADIDDHICGKINYKEYVDSEDSAEIGSSDDESVDTAVDSNASDEETRPEIARRKWHGDSSSAAAKVPRIPFSVKCAKSYLKQSAEDYRNAFLTNGTLYPQWRSCIMQLVPDDQISMYMPTVRESCNVIIGRADPVTFNQFEAKQQHGCSIFVGGCIQCISWAPPHVDDRQDDFGHFLAVACHKDVDAPRLDYEKTYEYSGLLQIWDFGDLSRAQPKFALGIAHDYGTIWAIDWCPSGARDVLSSLGSNDKSESDSDSFLRLGLLAIACSNGFAYILSVPYPSSLKTSIGSVYKLTPVAELRLSRGKRATFQATSITWTPQKGHETVTVGYSSGTVAMYNLECNSSLLVENEGGVVILYPFQDERPHGSSITDVKAFPSSVGAGLMSSVSPTGSQAAQLRGGARIHKHLSAHSAAFAPHWPGLMLSGNEIIVNQSVNELDFWGLGRRVGVVQKSCSCLHCGHMATFVPPVMKILTTHPSYVDFQKTPLAVLQMKPLSCRKRSKHKDDMLQVKLEPLTYHDAIKSYALEFKLMKDLDKDTIKAINRPRIQYPERFPLADVPSMAFYPSQNHHRKLAVATHAGVIFIIYDDNYL